MMTNKIKKLFSILFLSAACCVLPAETISNEYCSFNIPANMELQQGFFSNFSESFSADQDVIYKAVLQQKGLNSTTESIEGYINNSAVYDDYCRITISCKEGTGGLVNLNSAELDYFDDYMYELMASIYSIPKWNGIKKVSFKGYYAYILDYIRGSVAGNEDVHVYNMLVSTEAHDWTIIFAARERTLSKWTSSFREFGESFEFGKQEKKNSYSNPTINSYTIPSTSLRFNWYRQPKWQNEYVDGISVSSFYDENYDSNGYMNINIVVMNLSGMIYGRMEQLGFLYGVQQQIPITVSNAMSGLSLRVKENSIDSEHNIYTYRYSYSAGGMLVEGIVLYSFSGSRCIAFSSEWDAKHPLVAKIVDQYIDSVK